MKGTLSTLTLLVLAVAAVAQEQDWTAGAARYAAAFAKTAAARAAAAAASARPIVGVPDTDYVQLGWSTRRWWLSVTPASPRRLQVETQSCALDMEPGDCNFSVFQFPSLAVDEARREFTLDGAVVARYDARGRVTLSGYAVGMSATGNSTVGAHLGASLVPGSQKPFAAGAPESYFGFLDAGGRRQSLCFEVAPGKIDQYPHDPDITPGVFVHRALSVQEEGTFDPPSAEKSCASSWELNGDYVRDCFDRFLVDFRSAHDGEPIEGDVFDRLERFDAGTGRPNRAPIGRYHLQRIPSGCR